MRKSAQAPQLTDLQLDLLLALFEGPLTSGELVSAVTDLRQREAPLATFYRQLQRTIDLGWVRILDPAEVSSSRPGRPERRYRVAAAGARVLRNEMELFQRRVTRARSCGLFAERTP